MQDHLVKQNQLSAVASESEFTFTSLAEVEPCDDFIGQERARKAISMGLEIEQQGYNLYVMGEPGTGKISMVMRQLETAARLGNGQADWVYINNFDDVREPWVIQLPAGLGKTLIKNCQSMVNQILVSVPAAFESPNYQREKNAVDQLFNERFESAVETIEQQANQRSIALYQEGLNISFSPIIDGEAVDDVKFASLSRAQRNKINEAIDELEEKLGESLIELPTWRRESYDAMQKLNSRIIDNAIHRTVEELREKYLGLPGAQLYFKDVRRHLVDVILDHFGLVEEPTPKNKIVLKDLLHQTFVGNLLVTNDPSAGSPVIYEPRPSYANLFGQIEYWSEGGVSTTSFQHIRSGALHRANGGYLVLEIDKVFDEPDIWPQLKQALQINELKLESSTKNNQAMVPIGLSPKGVPLNVKLVLVGSREYYYVLQQNDSDFSELFRVLVDFDDQIERNATTTHQLAQLVKSRCIKRRWADITRQGYFELLQFGSRMCSHQLKLSTRFEELFNLLGEAEVIRSQGGDSNIDAKHIQEALKQRIHRHSRIRNEMLNDVLENRIIINTSKTAVGSINGLTVWQIGSTEFGMPARITATVAPGDKGVIDIEKESELGLSIHSKGILILSGYIANHYAKEFPLTLWANIVMEQSYGFIDGDSSSLAELCALLSAILDRPASQSLAVTGSINQFGDVQAVGGINEKIEGFFLLCKSRGLTGEQAVIIPKANLFNLMLNKEVIEAVDKKLFSVYAVEKAEQAFKLLGLLAGDSLVTFKKQVSKKIRYLYELSKSNNE